MTIKIQGTNTTAAPGITGGDTDTGVQFGTNEVKIVTGGTDRVVVDSTGASTFNKVLKVNRTGSGDGCFHAALNGTVKASIASDGTASFDGNISMGNGAGIDFSADANATGKTSELLDDYERGTWTPAFTGDSGTNSGQVYASQNGDYTKIGNIVILQYDCELSTKGTFSGTFAKINNFPFPVNNDVPTCNSGDCFFINTNTNIISLNHQLHETTSSSFLWCKTSASSSREYLTAGNLFSASTRLTGTIIYRTDS